MSLRIEMRFEDTVLASATGFLVRHQRLFSNITYLVTNRHNLRGRNNDTNECLDETYAAIPDSVVVVHNGPNKPNQVGTWTQKAEPLYDDEGRPLWLEHPDLGGQVDVVALPLVNLGASNLDLHRIDIWSPETSIFIGPSEVVSILGFPFKHTAGGSFAIWIQGAIASEPLLDMDELPRFLIDARTRKGCSGSPVFAYRSAGLVTLQDGLLHQFPHPIWRFLGVYSGRIDDRTDLGFVWKKQVITEIIEGQARGS